MAHNIATINGAQAVFTGRSNKAWHGLGKTIEGTATWQEAMILANLNWLVEKKRLYNEHGQQVNAWGTFRDIDGKFLGTVGDRYTIIQNHEAFSFIDGLIGVEGAHYDTAGALGNGEVIWCSAHLPSAGFEVVPGDAHQTYLLFKKAHDGSSSAIVKLTDVRVVCNNTLTSALHGNGEMIRIKHTKSAPERMEAARNLIASGQKTAEDIRDKMRQLADKKVTRDSMETILGRLFPADKDGKIATKSANNIADVLNLYESNDKNAFPEIRGSAYNLLNAVTEYTDHLRTAKGGGQEGMAKARAESAIFGSGEKFKTDALDVIYQVASQMPSMPQRQIFAPSTYVTYGAQPTAPSPIDSLLGMVDF